MRLLLLSFDKSYWDYPYNMFNYIYVDVAVDRYSYCTLFYNRLGIANLSHANPIIVIQAPIAVNVLIRSIPCFDRALFPLRPRLQRPWQYCQFGPLPWISVSLCLTVAILIHHRCSGSHRICHQWSFVNSLTASTIPKLPL